MSHSNIVKLKEVIRENDILYFVFEYMVSGFITSCFLISSVCPFKLIKDILSVLGVQSLPTYEGQAKTFFRD